MKKHLMYLPLLALTIFIFAFNNYNAKKDGLPTSLRITVIDNLGNFVEGAEVTLFENEDDYRAGTNPSAGPSTTDAKGRVKFKDLKPVSYFLHAVKDDKTNIGEGVKTAPLVEGRTNKVNTVIE